MKTLKQKLREYNVITSKNQINKKASLLLSRNKSLYDELITSTSFLTVSVEDRTRVFCVMNNIYNEPKCKVCGKPVTFNKSKGMFNVYCPNSISACSHADGELQAQRTKTMVTKYGTENPMQNEEIKNAAKKTMIERYGVPYPILSKDIKNKIKRTIKERYGVDNISSIAIVKQKREQTNIVKYGTTTFAESQIPSEIRIKLQNKELLIELLTDFTIQDVAKQLSISSHTVRKYIQKHKINASDYSNCNISSLPQRMISKYLTDWGIEHTVNERLLIYPKQLDIYIPKYKLAIEFDGIFFHSELSGKDKTYHRDKTQGCNNMGIRLIHVWSSEWETKQHIVLSRIKHALNISERTVYARKTKIVELDHLRTNNFFNTNHIQGNAKSSIVFGLEYEGELVAAMSFVKSRYDTSKQWELQRYSTKTETNVVGGASKLFRHFVKMHQPKNVISYCDLRWGTGNLYTQIGFVYSHTSNPNYFYFRKNGDTNKLFSRVKFQKHRLSALLEKFDSNLTEWENMKLNGYDRIWDCGNNVYVWKTQEISNSSDETRS